MRTAADPWAWSHDVVRRHSRRDQRAVRRCRAHPLLVIGKVMRLWMLALNAAYFDDRTVRRIVRRIVEDG